MRNLSQLFEQQDPITEEIENQKKTETEQLTSENAQRSSESKETGIESPLSEEKIPPIPKRKRGSPRKTMVVVKRTVSSNFDKRGKSNPALNKSKVPEPVLVVKQKRDRPLKALIQARLTLYPRKIRVQKAKVAL